MPFSCSKGTGLFRNFGYERQRRTQSSRPQRRRHPHLRHARPQRGPGPEVIVCNFDLKPGYAGVENPIYTREKGVCLELGDAKETLMRLMAGIA